MSIKCGPNAGKNGASDPVICFPVCDPVSPGEAWTSVRRIAMNGGDETIPVIVPKKEGEPLMGAPLPEGKRDLTDEEARSAAENGWPGKNGFAGMCRSEFKNVTGGYNYYVYKEHFTKAEFFAYRNEYNDSYKGLVERAGIELPAADIICLAESGKVKLRDSDVVCAKGACAKPGQPQSKGTYLFTDDPLRIPELQAGIREIKKGTNSCLENADAILDHLDAILDITPLKITEQNNLLTLLSLVLFGGLIFIAALGERRAKRLEELYKKMMEKMDEQGADIDGRKVTYREVVVDAIEVQKAELSKDGVFKQPYNDTGELLPQIIDTIFRPQGDQKNYFATGASRSGKSATSLRGLPQIYIISQMTDDERKAYFEKVTAEMMPADAEAFIRTTTAAAELLSKRLKEGGYTGFRVFDLSSSRLRGVGGVWKGKEDKVLNIVMDQIRELAKQGVKVVIFRDEVQVGNEGELSRGDVALNQKFKTFEEDPLLTFGKATTVEEAAETVATDEAAMNRTRIIFHESPAPASVIKWLSQRSYVKQFYGVEKLDYEAMQAIYLLGRRVDLRAASVTVAESFFMDVLQAAKEKSVRVLTFDFVVEYYEERYSKKHGQALLTKKNIANAMAHEEKEIGAENARDKAVLEKVVREAAGRPRIFEGWWESEVVGECIPDEKSSKTGRTPLQSVLDALDENQAYKGFFEGKSEAFRSRLASMIQKGWEGAIRAGQAQMWRLMDEARGIEVREDRPPASFIEASIKEAADFAGRHGFGIAPKKGEEKEKGRFEEDKDKGKEGPGGKKGGGIVH